MRRGDTLPANEPPRDGFGVTLLAMTPLGEVRSGPWRCPVCRHLLQRTEDQRAWRCAHGHSFDVAREGYVNLLSPGRRPGRQAGDSAEMVTARHRFLATGAFDRITGALSDVVAAERPRVVLDVACGEGHHTRGLRAPMVLGFDIAKPAVRIAAASDREGWYAVANAADVPLPDQAVDVAVVVFAPALPAELARVVRPGGSAVAVYPGPLHLTQLRSLVYAEGRPHEDKPPLRDGGPVWAPGTTTAVTYTIALTEVDALHDLFAMTPYRWHAPADIGERLAAATAPRFEVTVDVRITLFRRADPPPP